MEREDIDRCAAQDSADNSPCQLHEGRTPRRMSDDILFVWRTAQVAGRRSRAGMGGGLRGS